MNDNERDFFESLNSIFFHISVAIVTTAKRLQSLLKVRLLEVSTYDLTTIALLLLSVHNHFRNLRILSILVREWKIIGEACRLQIENFVDR